MYKQSHTVQAGRELGTDSGVYLPSLSAHSGNSSSSQTYTHTHTETHLDMFMVEVPCLRGLSPLSDNLPPACRHLTHRHTHTRTNTLVALN